ncbi:MAG: D-2-hydroxyacid dehydrogenase [Anaerolineales bacterium]|nr:MAG: D-2-hydroxyacid dehydrogenase [Anaerolineales bacterium]
MKIVVLDGYAGNPGDLSWDGLKALGPCEIHDRTPPADVVARAADAEIVLTNKVVMSREVVSQLPKLAYIGVLATGYNVVDLVAARERGIAVTNVPAYSTESVVQMVFAHLLNLAQHVAEHSQTARKGRWEKSPDFAYWDYPLVELSGKTMGIVGFGRIGRAVARVALSFGMRVIAHTPHPEAPALQGIEFAALEKLFAESDVVSFHCPLKPETESLVNAERLALMKQSAFLINTSRGRVIDEQALADALNEGRIAGAGVDVLSTEPPAPDNPLLAAQNCYITPHIGWATVAARQRLLETVAANVRAFLEGRPQNVVN